jgi:pre-rRNA-processing protein IPI1
MKRSSSASKKSQNSDFKRLKAKVGKRAPKKLNDTDTKFNTATVKVKAQNVSYDSTNVDTKGMQMISSRGKHLSQLILSLNHPSASVRSSSLQGIKDAVKNTPAEVIPYHLSIIMPSISKCIVDEDSDVRKLANLILFQDVSHRLLSINIGDRMRPFLPLTLAYIGSALHSLDQDVRYDGCCTLENLCTHFRFLFLDGSRGGNDMLKLEATLPAFSILFDDVSGGLASLSRRGIGNLSGIDKNATMSKKKKQGQDLTSMQNQVKDNNSKKQTKESKQKSARAEGVLKAFLAVIQITSFERVSSGLKDDFVYEKITVDNDASSGTMIIDRNKSLMPSMSMTDLEFRSGGRDSNGIVFNRKHNFSAANRSLSKMTNLEDLQSLHLNNFKDFSNTIERSSIQLSTQRELMLKLRDRYVEITQRGYKGDKGLYLNLLDVKECILIISNLRFLWNGYGRRVVMKYSEKSNQDSNIAQETKKMKQTACSIISLILESFPINDASGNTTVTYQQDFDNLNASMCMALSEFGSAVNNTTSNERDWLKATFSYVLPKLEYSEVTDISTVDRCFLLKVVEKLLVERDGNILEGKDYLRLLEVFGNSFFNQENIRKCPSNLTDGYRSTRLLSSLIHQFLGGGMRHIDVDSLNKQLSRMAACFPQYLVQWQGYAPEDSVTVLATLLAMSRKYNPDKGREVKDEMLPSEKFITQLCCSLRENMLEIFVSSKKLIKVSTTRFKSKQSVFEQLPEIGQKLAISLVGMLQYPSNSMLECLAEICSRRVKTSSGTYSPVLSDYMLDYIASVIHSISRTISLQTYLKFLVTSTGISNVKCCKIEEFPIRSADDTNKLVDASEDAAIDIDCITSYDLAISRCCRYIPFVPAAKAFKMLLPVLKAWLSNSHERSTANLVKARAAFATLSVLLHAQKLDVSDIIDNTVDSVYDSCMAVSSIDSDSLSTTFCIEIQSRMLAPIFAILFCYSSQMLIKFLENCKNKVLSTNIHTEEKRKIIQTLEYLLRNKTLTKVISTDASDTIRNTIKAIDAFTLGGPLDSCGGKLLILANQIIGNS